MRRIILFVILLTILLSQFVFTQTINIYTKTGSNFYNISDIDSINFLPLSDNRIKVMSVFTKTGTNSFDMADIDSMKILPSSQSQSISMNVITKTGIPSFKLSDIDSIRIFSNSTETVTDIDGNVYRTVTIGSQVWMAENLRTTRYRNGDSIPEVRDYAPWDSFTSGAYCDYNNFPFNAEIYGKLYNWYAVNDQKGLAPAGWHIPTLAEWNTLVNYLGGEMTAGGKLKETGITHWGNPNVGATNESCFTGLGGGMRYDMGGFTLRSTFGAWWSAEESGALKAWNKIASRYDGRFDSYEYPKQSGMSIRCVKD